MKRFKSNKQVLKQQRIYVYCPQYREGEIKSIINKYGFEAILNDYSVKNFSLKVICHFESASFEKWEKDYLVKATELGAWVEPLVSYLDRRMGFTEVQLLQSSYFLHQKAFTILSTKRTQIAKRVIDIISAIFLLIITLPIILITAILIKIESKGPVVYKQKRTGQYNEEFKVIKFRSMYSDAEASGAQWAKKNDNRITKIGRFIRKTRIDELPQFINVLRGEMSMVGPRPEREVFISDLEKVIKYYRFRHAVKPGITGLAQISYPYGASVEDAVWKHKYDIHYIKHHSTFVDLKIMIKTIKVVIFGMGR
ncbi:MULTISPECIES: exopolysaccharide biosynthesis polyprenyl glycosylphosphotransferase [unclassified Pseudoalteromonas]|nr:exopolysaccharide biosynthesis polyprenyl glycosylphosphotransferase [Pseudoalteromonas sp. NGC95]MBH0044827.1 exopolysaccharide biosynthesis polyprenyl glycosylphosphotransferase [Pseudoalteromonas sp. NZS11_1]